MQSQHGFQTAWDAWVDNDLAHLDKILVSGSLWRGIHHDDQKHVQHRWTRLLSGQATSPMQVFGRWLTWLRPRLITV